MATRRTAARNNNIMSDNNNIIEPTSNTGRYTTKEVSPLEIATDDISSSADPSSTQQTISNTNASSIDEQYKSEREQTKLRHWKESDYAAGLVEPTWSDEREKYSKEGCCCGCCCSSDMGQMLQEEIDPGCGCIYLSAIVCSRLGAGRIGNMAILKERYVMVEVDDDEELDDDNINIEEGGREQVDGYVDEEDGLALHQRSTNNNNNNGSSSSSNTKSSSYGKKSTKRLVRKREIQFMLGPFWPMLLFITYPLIFGVSALTMYSGLPGKPWYIQVGWAILTILLIRALFNTGFRDPGLLPRHKHPPAVKDDDDNESPSNRMGFRWRNNDGPWRWSDQAQSYRPRNSSYCPDCKVVIEEFDHT